VRLPVSRLSSHSCEGAVNLIQEIAIPITRRKPYCSCPRSSQSDFPRGMVIGARNGNDRLRTIWTPEMDRYFIDLLLEQVSKGNRFDDHLFSKRAWKHMTSLFNAKFKFQCEKDVLKNRHKTLRNQYRAVRSLLDQPGFIWDPNRQMVTADNSVWDEYIKVRPTASAFRIKTIPLYSDLCLIYGDAAIQGNAKSEDGVEQVPAEDDETKMGGVGDEDVEECLEQITVDGDKDVSLLRGELDDSMSKEVADVVEQATLDVARGVASSRSRTYWQPPMDRYFIDLMLEQMQKGNQFDGVFRKQAWMDMIAAFNGRFGFNYDVDVLKNRYKSLRRQHNVIKNLLGLDGFAWDDTRQMVTADDYVWQDYIKTYTDARQYMTRPVPYYKDLCVICNDENDGGNDSFCDQYLELQSDIPEESAGLGPKMNSPAVSVSGADDIGELHTTDSETIVSNQKNKRQLENPSNTSQPKRARGKEECVPDSTHEMVATVSSLSDQRNAENSSIPIEKVVEAIQALPDIDEDLVLDACDFLEDETKAKTFMALDVKLRKKWLLRKLRPES
ncbi:hypothetical protein Tsubulata_032040, partial [Turnera subulata]